MGVKRFDYNKLLEPYKEGGTESHPVERTLDTLAGKLIIANKIPPKIVGASIFTTFWELANGLEFKGDGRHGSAGAQLYNYIRNKCVEMGQEDAKQQAFNAISTITACVNKDCPKRTTLLVQLTKWQRFKRFLTRPRGWWSI